MATTYDYVGSTTTTQYFGTGAIANGKDRDYVMSRRVNLADAVTDFLTPAGGTAFGANDVLKVMNVPAKTWVKAVMVTVVTADTTVTDTDVGDGDNVDGYVDGLSLATAGVVAGSILQTDTTVTTAYSVPVGGGKYYLAADTIDVKLITAGGVDGVIDIVAVCTDMSNVNV